MMEVDRKAERERVNSAVYNRGERPQRVCARFWWKLKQFVSNGKDPDEQADSQVEQGCGFIFRHEAQRNRINVISDVE